MRFYSKEWVEAVVKKVNSDKEYLDKAKKLTGSFMSIVTDCPDGNDVKFWIKFNKGKAVDYEYEAKPTPASFRIETEPWDKSKSLVKAQADYETFRRLQKGEINPAEAMGSGQYKVDGDMIKLIALMPYQKAYTELHATIECEY